MGNVRHFAINADDVGRARSFYATVFGWQFKPWGPPGFYMIAAGGETASPLGSLQPRRELAPGRRTNAFECTIAVERDVEELGREIEAHGGRVLMPKATIPGVGSLIFFEDPDGNIAGAMRYEIAPG